MIILLLLLILFLSTVWDKLLFLYVVVMIVVMGCSLKTYFIEGVESKLKFVSGAQNDGRTVMAKMTCLTKEGKIGEANYCAEYMYVLSNKRYFTTYRITPQNISETSKEEISGELLASSIQKFITLYYDDKNPEKVCCRAELFASREAFHKMDNSKNNIYRDTDKDWKDAIDLTTY